jgi:ATP:corrinoid adenosyltransferase
LTELLPVALIPPMAFSGMFMLGFLVTLPVLVAEWIGILGLRHGGKGGAWWSMAVGVALNTVGAVTSVASMFFLRGGWVGGEMLMLIAFSAVPALGSLLFAIGFAMHGLKASRSASRMQELEQLAAAMSEEISQLRAKASQAL